MKKRDKNSLVSFVDRMFSSNKTPKFKRNLLIFSVFGFVSSITLSVTLPIVLKSKTEDSIYYKFDNNYFSSKEEVYQYSQSRSLKSNYSFETNKYLFNDEVFNSKDELDQYMENKFEVKSMTTKRNPNDYVINSAGELSALVKTSGYEETQTIYKGMNDLTYFSEEDALETYLDNYSLNYEIDGQVYDNIYSAREYYLNIKLEELKENQQKTICYEQGGMCQTKEQIMAWLRNNTVKGFEYKGKDFSNLNYGEFLTAMNDLDEHTINKNIAPVLNADRSSYWVTQNTKHSLAYFVGPKYFESNEAVSTVAQFEPIKSYDVNALLLPLSGWLFAGITTVVLNSLIEEPTGSDYEMMDYLTRTFEDLNLDKKSLINFEDYFYQPLSPNLQEDLSYGLNEIKDSELNDFYRLLISFKRFLDLSKIYGIRGKEPAELEQLLKEIIVEILNSQQEFMNNMININDDEAGAEILLDESITFDDIYNLFLNTGAFFNDGGTKKILWDMAEKILTGIDKVMDTMGKLSDNIGKVIDNNEKLQKESDKSDEKFGATSEENFQLATRTLVDNNDEFTKALGLELKDSKVRFSPLIIAQMVSSIWNIGQMFSFISLKTYEAKLDSNQSLFYFEPTFKIPLINISFGSKVKAQDIYTLNEAPLNYFSPSANGEELKQLYEFNGKYYKEKQKAIDDLKYEIYKKPENYLKTKELFTSVISKDNNYILDIPMVCTSTDTNEDCISGYEYEKRLAEEKQKYIELLFTQFYEETGKEYFLDGFGGAHESQQLAIQQLEKKADNFSNYKEVYSYMLYNNKVIKDSKLEMQQFIRDNQIIESKSIINTDLITTSYYDNLQENHGYDFNIYEMNFYGQKKYFRSFLEAVKYLDTKVNYEVYSYNREEKTYDYKGIEFMNQQQFEQWVDRQIEIVGEQEYLNNGGDLNAKNYFNSVRH